MKFTISLIVELEGPKSQPLLTRLSWRRRKKQIGQRDGEICQYCGQQAPDGQPDHIIPLSKGGTDALDNLVWACRGCNESKGNKTLEEWQPLPRIALAPEIEADASTEDEHRSAGRPADPLDPDVIAYVLENNGDVSQRELNRRFSIGFSKAKRTIEHVKELQECANPQDTIEEIAVSDDDVALSP